MKANDSKEDTKKYDESIQNTTKGNYSKVDTSIENDRKMETGYSFGTSTKI